ncbi:MAG: hypothetical protein Q8L34_03275 [Candidatus Woesearchaeota archaeon]|nr:hypothetical protein [Candidatus Woesearchaeota archaeon]
MTNYRRRIISNLSFLERRDGIERMFCKVAVIEELSDAEKSQVQGIDTVITGWITEHQTTTFKIFCPSGDPIQFHQEGPAGVLFVGGKRYRLEPHLRTVVRYEDRTFQSISEITRYVEKLLRN